MNTALAKSDGMLRATEKFGVRIGAAMMFMIMMIVVADVGLRYIFNSPLTWSYDLISLYLMVGLFFLALSDTLASHAHVSVDILHLYMRPRMRHTAEFIGYLCAIPVFASIVYMATLSTVAAFKGGDVLAGHIAWPTWLARGFVPVGAGVLLLRIVHRCIGHGMSIAQNRSLTALPPVAGTEGV